MVKAILLGVLVTACQGGGTDTASRVETGGNRDAGRTADGASRVGFGNHDAQLAAGSDEHPANKPDEPEPTGDPNKTIIQLGAMPAWQAVVDRTQYLARRNQHGVVYGLIGPADPPYVWLSDDTEGNGTLGIRVALGMKAAKEGERVALGGAWQLDDTRRWFWQTDSLALLPAGTATDLKEPRAAVPTHALANGELPNGARTIGVAKDGDAVYFTVVGAPPAIDGDGWQVADELGNPTSAIMTLPGERASYGGQDMRAPDERWSLRRGQTYWVRIGYFRKHGDKLRTVIARTAPVRVK